MVAGGRKRESYAKSLFGPDILSALIGLKKIEMLQLMHKFNSGQIQIQEFIANMRVLIGPRLYGQLIANLNEINKANRAKILNQNFRKMTPQEMLGPGLRALTEALTSDSNVPVPVERPPSPYASEALKQANIVNEAKRIPIQSSQSDTQSQPTATDNKQLDTDSLQDILKYSGIDLKAEADAILKEQDFILSHVAFSSGKDPKSRANLLYNVDFLKTAMTTTASRLRLSNANSLDPMLMEMMLYALQIRFSNIIDEVVTIGRNRVDILRARFRMKIENDPRRQLFVLDKVLANRNRKFLAPPGALGTVEDVSSIISRDFDDSNLPIKRSRVGEDSIQGSIAPEKIGKILEKDEQAIKSRLTNATALSQLGVPLKSWMVGGQTAPTTSMNMSFSGSSENISSTSLNAENVADVELGHAMHDEGMDMDLSLRHVSSPRPMQVPPVTHSLSSSSSQPGGGMVSIVHGISDKEWRTVVFERRITLRDLLFFMSYDTELSHSVLLTKVYYALK